MTVMSASIDYILFALLFGSAYCFWRDATHLVTALLKYGYNINCSEHPVGVEIFNRTVRNNRITVKAVTGQ